MALQQQMYASPGTPGTVLCCLCGVNIPPNPANMCANCIRSQVRARGASGANGGGPADMGLGVSDRV
jgi:hypothetical protein